MRRRFFAELAAGGQAEVRGPEAAHLARVLRAQPGQCFDLACAGALYLGRVAGVSATCVRFELVEAVPAPPPPPPLEIAPALFKFDRVEWMLEKATELGAVRILPFTCRRADPHLAERAPARLARWRAIALAAAQQARRLDLPVIEAPVPLVARLAEPFAGVRLLLSEDPEHPRLEAAAAPSDGSHGLRLLAGPEGGWTPEEAAAAEAAGYRPVSLGPRILRCETAILVALARAGAKEVRAAAAAV